MSDDTATPRATCKACGSPRDPMAIAYTAHCSICLGCFTCGRPGVGASITAHVCPGVPVVATSFGTSDPTHPGYVHSTNPYVEGREAPRREGPACAVCGHGYAFHHASLVGCTAGSELGSCQCSKYTDAATVEACARAAYVASWRNSPTVLPWEAISEDDRERGREVARAVLAAAGRGGL